MNAIATSGRRRIDANSAPTMNSESRSGDRAIEDLQQDVEDEQLGLVQRGQQVRAAVLEVIVVRLRQDPSWISTASSWPKPNTKAWVDQTSWTLTIAATTATVVNRPAAATSMSQFVWAPKVASVGPIKREFPGPLGVGEHGEEGHHRREGREFRDCAREHQRQQGVELPAAGRGHDGEQAPHGRYELHFDVGGQWLDPAARWASRTARGHC